VTFAFNAASSTSAQQRAALLAARETLNQALGV